MKSNFTNDAGNTGELKGVDRMAEVIPPIDKTEFIPIELDKKKKKKPRKEKRYMGLYAIFQKTLLELFSIKRVLPYLFLSFIFPVIFTTALTNTLGDIYLMNIDYQISVITNYFAFYAFFWNAGILLWLFSGLTASTFILSEINQGTMIFLLTKPIRRSTIYIGKYLGYLVNMIILQFFSLLIALTTTCTIFRVSLKVFSVGMYYFIPIFLFSILLIASIGFIMGFLSIINRRAVVGVLVNMLLIIIIYFVGIIFRLAVPQYYTLYKLYLIDLGYQLSIIFIFLLGLFGFQPIPTFQQNMGLFFGTYPSMFGQASKYLSNIDPENGITVIAAENNFISPLVSLIFLASITILLLILGLVLLERKDISPA
ncbi:MAG: ABC transporter permease subunit [Candidatus Heimdallarchaeota archaeon]|nr:ABC transporter permease subunit [Candidatus Heimdallarchaeota archaeon]